MGTRGKIFFSWLFLLSNAYADSIPVEEFRGLVENDWNLQDQYFSIGAVKPGKLPRQGGRRGYFPIIRAGKPGNPKEREADAAGAVDGIKTGLYGFHTEREDSPWWQVDFGKSEAISRVVIWNRDDRESNSSRIRRIKMLFSEDAKRWKEVWQNKGETFYGAVKNRPRTIDLGGKYRTRYIRLMLPEKNFFHLDEVEVFTPSSPGVNIALHRPATQSSVSRFSVTTRIPQGKKDFAERWKAREVFLRDPLLDFDAILFAKRVPPSYNHMSDQYFGWWIRPGGGIYILKDFKTDHPRTLCLTESFKEPGSFLRPTLSYDGKKVLFAWARYYPHVSQVSDKTDKGRLPEDSFFHLFEMNIDGTGLRQLTRGKYNDFDGRYLPNGKIVFLSTRRGPWIQAGRETGNRTMERMDLPEAYVRCGGYWARPCAVYTLHTMDSDGGNITTLSPFEMFEWTPSVNHDGTIIYSRWDYVDRHNQYFMGLWSVNPDGTNARLLYGNYTRNPLSTFEPRAIPNSNKLVFTATAHHAHTMGSLVLLDPTVGMEYNHPIKRLTPEVLFPESEKPVNPAFYAHPWPLSEELYLVSWELSPQIINTYRRGWNGYYSLRPANNMGIYLYRSDGTRELLYRDPKIGSCWPIPVKPRVRPPVRSEQTDWSGPQMGRFLLTDVYHGLKKSVRGEIKALRIVALPPKTQPYKNRPSIGLTADDPGKILLGTVPVEPDGSAFFSVPSGVSLFFQALDKNGMAVHTMRSASYVMPGTTLSCNGCHEPRNSAGVNQRPPLASLKAPSRIKPGPDGTWPLRYDKLVKPVLDRSCVSCHNPGSGNKRAATFDLSGTPRESYERLTRWGGKKSLRGDVVGRYNAGSSVEKGGGSYISPLLKKITVSSSHPRVRLSEEERMRLVIWMDLYAQFQGYFSPEQEKEALRLKEKWDYLLTR